MFCKMDQEIPQPTSLLAVSPDRCSFCFAFVWSELTKGVLRLLSTSCADVLLVVCRCVAAPISTCLFLGTWSGIWGAWFHLWYLLSDWAGLPGCFHSWFYIFGHIWDPGHDLHGTALHSRDCHVALPAFWSTCFRGCFSLRPCTCMFPQLALPANFGTLQRPTASPEGGWTCDSPTAFFFFYSDYMLSLALELLVPSCQAIWLLNVNDMVVFRCFWCMWSCEYIRETGELAIV